ncbi:ATP-binding protein [Boudabousia marimammalium]|uniref:ATP-binding protein n=1 Tax=Boudabousia marimammalium TaxID=156892 RepID=UPI001FE435D9|nr:DUF4143 domain-containing protein [Boudabousia marimammalium]
MALHERGLVKPTVSLRALLEGVSQLPALRSEFGLADYFAAITASGFPAVQQTVPRLQRAQLDSYLERIIDHDLPNEGFVVRRPETLRRWMSAYATASSTTTSYSRLLDATTAGDGSQPAKTTTRNYIDHLERLWILDPVPGWIPSNNPIRRLQQAPKRQLADPALAARLLGLNASSLAGPSGAHMAGPLFESLVTLGVRVAAQAAEARVYHLRTNEGRHEIDLIVEGEDGRVLAIEVKLSGAVHDQDVRHLLWLREQIPDRVVDLLVVNTGPATYRRSDGVGVVPLALLGA